MAGVFRRPPDIRITSAAVAVLLAAGSPTAPPLSRSNAQESFYSSVKPKVSETYKRPQSHVAVFSASPQVDSPPLKQNQIQESFYYSVKLKTFTQGLIKSEAALFSGSIADTPPLSRFDSQESFFSLSTPKRNFDSFRPLHPDVMDLYESEGSIGPLTSDNFNRLFIPKNFNYGQKPPLNPALFPAVVVPDEPPLSRFVQPTSRTAPWAQQEPPLNPALFPAVVAPDEPPLGRAFSQFLPNSFRLNQVGFKFPVPLYPIILPDNPPITGVPSQGLFWNGYRIPALKPTGGSTLSVGLFPIEIVDDPPLIRSVSNTAFWTSLRPIWVDTLRSLPKLFPEIMHITPVPGSCDLTGVLARLDAIEASLTVNHDLIVLLQEGINFLILASSSVSFTSTTQYAEIVANFEKMIKLQKTILSDQSIMAIQKKERGV